MLLKVDYENYTLEQLVEYEENLLLESDTALKEMHEAGRAGDVEESRMQEKRCDDLRHRASEVLKKINTLKK